MAELKYWLWLATRNGISVRLLGELLRYFGSPENVFFARREEYRSCLSGDLSTLDDKSLTAARKIMADCEKAGAEILTLGDARYPARLKNIADPPIVLYIKGRLPDMDDEAAVAIVGTRRASSYGLGTAEKAAYDFSRGGGLVVTGLAHGIDSAAARGALRAGAKVVGVLGCGIDVIYPATNGPLFRDVEKVGALVSEYPPGVRPDRTFFPARNRIMSGLSAGVLVVEAPLRSGALITASRALEQGRDVFVVPGLVDADVCRGSNELLKEGAIPALSGEDLVAEYEPLFPHRLGRGRERFDLDPEGRENMIRREQAYMEESRKETKTTAPEKVPHKEPKKPIDKDNPEDYIEISVNEGELAPAELAVIRTLGRDTLHVDELMERCELPADELLATLTMLEIAGYVEQEPGKRFISRIMLK